MCQNDKRSRILLVKWDGNAVILNKLCIILIYSKFTLRNSWPYPKYLSNTNFNKKPVFPIFAEICTLHT